MISDQVKEQYRTLQSTCGMLRMPRTLLELGGQDRAAFLHNLCTNDIKKLLPGQGCEAFLTDVKGKTIGHAIVGVEEDSILIDTVEGQSELLLPHFDRYIIMDDVSLVDRTDEWADVVLAGAKASDVLSMAFGVDTPPELFARTEFDQGRIRRVPFTNFDTYLITTTQSAVDDVVNRLSLQGATETVFEAFEIARIEAFFPWFGKDFSADNLPQEVDRDAEAISFTKGCYLGQETVARIDAIGHVNRKLSRIKLASDRTLPVGTEVTIDGTSVGSTHSCAYSMEHNATVAIVLLKCDYAAAGTELKAADVDAIVI